MRKWRSAAVTAAWVAVGTAAGALGAWQLASSDGGGAAHSRPLDEAAVRRALTATSSTPSPPASSPSTSPSSAEPTPTERSTVRFTGGTATAECRRDGTVYLVSWSPADGFHIDDDVERGPGAVARLEAEPSDDDERDDLAYEIRCGAEGEPRARVVGDADD
ncbi:hypothetical protein OG453_02410 [Streptomyces sp. NBC_01381]|uniref:hypothetical protein n=1 Tax=Streptomyces sp. NBC_01381 TaxID=2903845 RepID=UPI002250876F|nr:hypothetical protein [Streptomyces sp. NBC_01381]MCX4665535.1 hypothetical protein [Streptomyces sp. NBC_01381]